MESIACCNKFERPTSATGHSRQTKPGSSFVRCPLCPKSRQLASRLGMSALCHKRSSFNNDRAALIPSIARRRVGQVQPEDDLVLVVEAEGLAGGLELCAARVLNADLEASRPILIKLMIHAPPNAHGRRGRAPRKLVVPPLGQKIAAPAPM
jgi:hypothetical protein